MTTKQRARAAAKPRATGTEPTQLQATHDVQVEAILKLIETPAHNPGFFRGLAQRASSAMGRPLAFATALAVVIVWACLGPVFRYSDTWQLVINTGTTIITFLMVFLIQSAQNRDTEALRIKLDALILALSNVSNAFIDVEELDDEELGLLRKRLQTLASKATTRR